MKDRFLGVQVYTPTIKAIQCSTVRKLLYSAVLCHTQLHTLRCPHNIYTFINASDLFQYFFGWKGYEAYSRLRRNQARFRESVVTGRSRNRARSWFQRAAQNFRSIQNDQAKLLWGRCRHICTNWLLRNYWLWVTQQRHPPELSRPSRLVDAELFPGGVIFSENNAKCYTAPE